MQAGSGNTSVKLDGVLSVKASGKWLAHAASEEILVPVDMDEIKYCIQCKRDFVAQYTSQSGHRLVPSIETVMHAVVPRAAHPRSFGKHHCLGGTGRRTCTSGRSACGPALAVDSVRGLGTAARSRGREDFANSPETEILILGNHGLVVCADDAETAEELLFQVEKRLAIEPRLAPAPDRALLQRIARGSEWCLPDLEAVHALSTDAISRTILVEGMLYPCQAIFLGPSTPVLVSSFPVSDAINRMSVVTALAPASFWWKTVESSSAQP